MRYSLAPRHLLHVDQILDELIQLVPAELQLAAEGPNGEAALLLQHFARALQLGDEAQAAGLAGLGFTGRADPAPASLNSRRRVAQGDELPPAPKLYRLHRGQLPEL
jgi:hypothetical protein